MPNLKETPCKGFAFLHDSSIIYSPWIKNNREEDDLKSTFVFIMTSYVTRHRSIKTRTKIHNSAYSHLILTKIDHNKKENILRLFHDITFLYETVHFGLICKK